MSIVDRAAKIILQPTEEWPVIDREPTSVGELYKTYIIPLAAIGPIASIIGWSVVGLGSRMAGTFRSPIGAAVIQGIVQYVLGLAGVFVLAVIIDELAPTFNGQKNRLQALKVAAYSSTTVWLVGIAGLVPALSILWLLSLYSLYPLSVGLPRLMKVPGEKAMDYTVVVAICAVVLFFIVEIIGTRTPGM